MTLEEKLSEFKAKAEAATPGPWVEDDGNVFSAPISNADYEARSAARRNGNPQPPRGYDGEVAKCSQQLPNFDADATYIAAANPAVVLALVEVARAAPELVDRVLGHGGVSTSMIGVAFALKAALESLDAALGER
jgi:hypothetical protein